MKFFIQTLIVLSLVAGITSCSVEPEPIDYGKAQCDFCKMNIVDQLNKAAMTAPVKGYLQDGTQTQEGFVSHGLKFVDRMGFSRQNLAGR